MILKYILRLGKTDKYGDRKFGIKITNIWVIIKKMILTGSLA